MNNKQYTSLLDDTPEIVILADAHGKIVFFNKAAHLFFDYDSVADLSVYDLFESRLHTTIRDFFSQSSHLGQSPVLTEDTLAISQDHIEQPVRLLLSHVSRQEERLFMLVVEDPTGADDSSSRQAVTGGGASLPVAPPPPGELFLLASADLTINYVSANCRAYLGYTSSEIIQKFSFHDLLYAEDQEKLQTLSSDHIISGVVSVTTPMRIKHRAGGYLPMPTRIDRFFNKQGELTYFVMRLGKATDPSSRPRPITERVQYFKLISQHTNDVVCFYNQDLTLRYVSPSIEHVLGYREDELINREITEFLHPEDVSRVQESFSRARDKAVENIHCRIKDSEGHYTETELSFKVIEQSGNDQLPLLTLLRGIDRFPILSPDTANRNNLLAQSVFDHLSDALLLLQPATWQIVDANERAVELLGFSNKSQLLKRKLPSLWKDENRQDLIRQLTHLPAIGGMDIEYQRLAGDTFWGDTSLVSLPRADEPTLLLHIADVSQRKQSEQQLTLAKEEAERTARSQENFLSTISHEIRTPLNAVLGLASLMLDSNPREDQRKLLETLKFSGDNLSALMNDILGYAKLKAGKVTLEREPFSLLSFLQGTKFIYRSLAQQQGVTFRLLLEDGLPETVLGDVNRLGQVLNNLLNNAVKFTPQGGRIVCSVYQAGASDNVCTLMFEIEDSGVGIPADRLSAVFEPYQQAKADTDQQYGGTGLGLSIVKNLVELQQGTIDLHSVEGEGTTFRVRLPFHLPNHQEAAEEKERSTLPRLSEYPSLEGLRVLYADDVIPNQLLMEGLANKWNITLDTALNGRTALEKAKNYRYDAILMDIQMPEMDGYEATQAIRHLSDSYYQALPIIALSASVSDHVRHRIHQSGMNDYLPKPLDTHLLHAKLSAIAKEQPAPSPKAADLSEPTLVEKPDFTPLRELYSDDEEGYLYMLRQIKQLTAESEAVILEAIHYKKVESLRFASHKIMSYVRMLKLRRLEDLLGSAKQYAASADSTSSDELIERVQFHFDNFMATITQEIEVHTV